MKYMKTVVPVCAVIIFSLVFPLLIADPSTTSTTVEILLLIGVAVAWNVFSGYTGYISLGHAAYYGLGAYILALVSQDLHLSGGYEVFLLLPLAGLAAGLVALPLGWITLRTRKYTFMVITIAIFFIFQLLAYNLRDLTGGGNGIFLAQPTWSADLYNLPFYYVALALLLLLIFISWQIRQSKYGLVLLALRDDEERVSSLGLRPEYYKLGAYVLSATFTGMLGALAIFFAGLVTPSSAFDQTLDITIVTITFFGGIGSVTGPIIGGLLLEPLQAYLTQQYGSAAIGINQVLFGAFLLAFILLLPEGLVPSLHKRWQARRKLQGKQSLTEIVLAPIKTPLDLSLERTGPLVVQQTLAQLPPIRQYSAVRTVPSRKTQQFEYSPELVAVSHKMKAQRLVPMVHTSVSGTTTSPADISWRCPTCKVPFLLNGDVCYCRKCGFTRPIAEYGVKVSYQ